LRKWASQLEAAQLLVGEARAVETSDSEERVRQQFIAKSAIAAFGHIAFVAEGLGRLVYAVELRLRVVSTAPDVADLRRDVPGQLALNAERKIVYFRHDEIGVRIAEALTKERFQPETAARRAQYALRERVGERVGSRCAAAVKGRDERRLDAEAV